MVTTVAKVSVESYVGSDLSSGKWPTPGKSHYRASGWLKWVLAVGEKWHL